ncbi:MAG: sigma-70 family RNA polymerase sigma factor [Gammaproteobacteria bacterium]
MNQATIAGDGLTIVTDNALPETNDNQGDLESFLGEVSKQAYQIAYGALWDQELAFDVVQEAMLKLVEYYRERPADQWPALFRTVLNSKINDQRRKRMFHQSKAKLLSLTGLGQKDKEGTMEAELPSRDQRSDGVSRPESDAHSHELKSRIDAAMLKLPERQRQVFLLREKNGMSIKQSAEILGCSENSIKQHHFRAMRTLRVELAEVWNHE